MVEGIAEWIVLALQVVFRRDFSGFRWWKGSGVVEADGRLLGELGGSTGRGMMVGTGLVSEEKRRENSAENQREKKRLSVGILWISLVLSLGWQKVIEGGIKQGFYQKPEAAGRELWNSNSTGAVHCS